MTGQPSLMSIIASAYEGDRDEQSVMQVAKLHGYIIDEETIHAAWNGLMFKESLKRETVPKNTIIIIGYDSTGQRVSHGSRSSSDVHKDITLMESFLELEQATRLRQVTVGPRMLGSLEVRTPEPSISLDVYYSGRHPVYFPKATGTAAEQAGCECNPDTLPATHVKGSTGCMYRGS